MDALVNVQRQLQGHRLLALNRLQIARAELDVFQKSGSFDSIIFQDPKTLNLNP